MSGTQPATPTSSTSNFILIFEAAKKDYNKLTKQDLDTHPLSVEFSSCNSPDAVLNIFRKQVEIFDEIRKGDERLIKWLDPMVHILFTFSAALGEGVGLVSSHEIHSSHTTVDVFSDIFTRKSNLCWRRSASYSGYPSTLSEITAHRVTFELFQAAKDVIASYDTLSSLFERMKGFLQRLEVYNGTPLTHAMTEVLGNIMAELLFIFALVTKEMEQSRFSESAHPTRDFWLTMGQRKS